MFERVTHPKVTGDGIDAQLVIERIEQMEGWEPTLNGEGEITAVKTE